MPDLATYPHWRRNQAAVTLATFIGFAGFTVVMPFLPLYFEQLGVHETGEIAVWSGLSLGVTPAVTAALAPLWSRVADRFGRKLMVVRSLLSFVIIMALLGFVNAPWQVFALRTIQGLFAGYGPIVLTMAAESSPREHLATAIGWVQTAQRLGPALGPVIGGTLAQTLGLRGSFEVAAGFYFVAFVLVVVGFHEPPRIGGLAEAPASAPTSWRDLRSVPHFVLFVGAVFGLQLVDRSFGPVLPLYLREVGISEPRIPLLSGVLFTATAAAAAVGNQTTRWLVDRVPPGRLVPVTSVIAGVAVAVFGLSPWLTGLILSAVVLGYAIGVATTSVYTAAGRSVDPAMRGVAFGYLTTAYLSGLAVSPVLAGLIGSFHMRTVFFVDAIGLGVVASVVSLRMAPR